MEFPRLGDHDPVAGVAGASNDVRAVGNCRDIAEPFHAATYHWYGSSWSHIPNPIANEVHSGLIDIAASAATDV